MAHEIRLWGDPLRADPSSQRLRQLLQLAEARGLRCGLCLSAARGEVSGRAVPLTNGSRQYVAHTRLPDPELRRVMAAGDRAVSSTAPLVVFGSDLEVEQAALEFEQSSLVVAAGAQDAEALLARVLAHLDRVEWETPAHGLSRETLQPYLDILPVIGGSGGSGNLFLHLGTLDDAAGTDRVIEAFGEVWREAPRTRLEVFLPRRDAAFEKRLTRKLAPGARVAASFHAGEPQPQDLVRATAVVQPLREPRLVEFLVKAMASARPLVASRFAETAQVLSAPGICYPVGGRLVKGAATHFEPDVRMVVWAMRNLMEEPAKAREMAMRARGHVYTHLVGERPRPPAAEVLGGARPVVVLEAPLFETSSSAVLTLATARTLQRRNRVELRLRPSAPFAEGLEVFAQRAPDLVNLLTRQAGAPDLWVTCGWPPRPTRPPARRFAMRVDWEYGALPTELSPLATQARGNDVIIVHSQAVRRTLGAAGCDLSHVELVPHGVDGEVFKEDTPPLERVLEFKGDRVALLFVGGLIWRKGVDLLLKTLLESYRREDPLCLVVKPMGATGSYSGYGLEELVRRIQKHPSAPEILLLEETLDIHEMAGLYTACDLLVHPYRGEGFGMPVLEARASGLPTVVTEGGSTDDFCSGEACLHVPSTRRFVDLPGVYIGRPFVLEPDAEALGMLVREAVRDSDRLRAIAVRDAPAVRRTHGWDRAAEHIERLAFAAFEPTSQPDSLAATGSTVTTRVTT